MTSVPHWLTLTAPVFFREFGEPITYDDGAVPRSIVAVVSREPWQSLAEHGEMLAGDFVVCVRNDPVDGIDATSLDVGTAAILVPMRPGEPPKRRELVAVLAQDEGVLTLHVR